MKRILLTGAARGLGKALQEHLTQKNYFVYGTSRNPPDPKLVPQNVQFFQLDLSNSASIDDLVSHFLTSKEKIDGIIHNSGIAYLDPADVLDDSESQFIFDVNFFGPMNLTKKLLPILKENEKSNLIFISSIVSINPWPHLGVYAASKAALEAVAFEWAILLKQWNIHVSVIQPNPLPTDMQIQRSKNCQNSPYPELKERNLEWESVAECCNKVFEILEGRELKFRSQTGSFSKEVASYYINQEAYEETIERLC